MTFAATSDGPRNVKVARRRIAPGALVLVTAMASVFAIIPDARAQQEVVEVQLLPRFTVELIVFTYREDSAGNEIFVPEKSTFDERDEGFAQGEPGQGEFSPREDAQGNGERAGMVFGDAAATAAEEPSSRQTEAGQEESQQTPLREHIPVREQIELELLDAAAYPMDEVYRKLQRLDAYEPIMRSAWTQTTPGKDVAPAVHLRALGDLPAGLDGSVKLYLSRFLHLVVDVSLDEDAGRGTPSATDRLVAYGDGRAADDGRNPGVGGMLHRPVLYRIGEDRIMKSGDIRYFDHPRFGVVAKVTRAEDPLATGADENPGAAD